MCSKNFSGQGQGRPVPVLDRVMGNASRGRAQCHGADFYKFLKVFIAKTYMT